MCLATILISFIIIGGITAGGTLLIIHIVNRGKEYKEYREKTEKIIDNEYNKRKEKEEEEKK